MRCHPDRFTCEVCHKAGLTKQGFVHFYREGQSLMRHPDCDLKAWAEQQVELVKRERVPA